VAVTQAGLSRRRARFSSPFQFDQDGHARIIDQELSRAGAGQIVERDLKLTSDPGRN
jgi:hypothetical protein